jgi:pilus assembly protein Flp/PilA
MRTRRGLADDSGASAVEYSLIAAAIAALIVVVVFAFGGAAQGLFKNTCDSLKSGLDLSGSCSTT